MSQIYQLSIKDFFLWVYLGVSEAEKQSPQAISLDIEISASVLPKGIFSDQISDTLCYDQLLKTIKQKIEQHGSFNLIENLMACVYASVYHVLLPNFDKSTSLKVSVHKLNPPVPYLQGGVTSSYEDNLTSGAAHALYRHWFKSR